MFEGLIDWTRMLIVLYPDHADSEVRALEEGRNDVGEITAYDSINLWALHDQPEILEHPDPGW